MGTSPRIPTESYSTSLQFVNITIRRYLISVQDMIQAPDFVKAIFFTGSESAEIISLSVRRRNEGVDVNIDWLLPPPWTVLKLDLSPLDGSSPIHYSAITHEPINAHPHQNTGSFMRVNNDIVVIRHASDCVADLYDIGPDEVMRLRAALSAMGKL
jgi:hypothetical protein